MKKEFRLTGKHLTVSAVVGMAICALLIQGGLSNPEAYFYAGSYNTHDPEFVNANPNAHKTFSYTWAECSDCHSAEDAWTPASGYTCNTAGCHTTLDERYSGDAGAKYPFNPTAYNYHQLVESKGLDCGSCHRIHEFREIEATWYGTGFDHAMMVPDWSRANDCSTCHESFDFVGEVSDVLKSVPGHEELGRGDLDKLSRRWLSASALREIERRELGLTEGSELRFQFRTTPYNEVAVDRARGESGAVVLYFRTEEARAEGGVCRVLEEDYFSVGAVAAEVQRYPVFTVDYESAPDAWAAFGVYRGGTLIIYRRDGTKSMLTRFGGAADLVTFLKAG
jgi:hypothetical protein